jgi:anti-sigma factor ChrR (cupin superfamily)
MSKKKPLQGEKTPKQPTEDVLDYMLIEKLNNAHSEIVPLPVVKARMHSQLLKNIQAKKAKISAVPVSTAKKNIPLLDTVTIRENEGEWVAVKSKITVKPLSLDRVAGTRSFLMRLQAGAQWPAHEHSVDEECLVLQGNITIGDLTISEGDYHLAPKGVAHGEFISEKGALLFLRAGIKDTELSMGVKAAYVWQRFNRGLKGLFE